MPTTIRGRFSLDKGSVILAKVAFNHAAWKGGCDWPVICRVKCTFPQRQAIAGISAGKMRWPKMLFLPRKTPNVLSAFIPRIFFFYTSAFRAALSAQASPGVATPRLWWRVKVEFKEKL